MQSPGEYQSESNPGKRPKVKSQSWSIDDVDSQPHILYIYIYIYMYKRRAIFYRMDRVIGFTLWDFSRIVPSPYTPCGFRAPQHSALAHGLCCHMPSKARWLQGACLPHTRPAVCPSCPRISINRLASSASRMGRATHASMQAVTASIQDNKS